MFVEVIINNNAKALNRTFDYSVPKELENLVHIGSRVSIPFGRNKTSDDGFVINIKKSSEFECKDILKVTEENSLTKDNIELARLMARKYFCNISDCIKLMLAPGTWSKDEQNRMKDKKGNFVYLNIEKEELESFISDGKIKRENHIRVLNFLKDNEGIYKSDLEALADASSAVLKTLEKNGLIRFESEKIERNPFINKKVKQDSPKDLNEEQSKCYNEIALDVDNAINSVNLIYGITGSGKTEIYLQLIAKVLENDKRAIVLVPEISLTPQMVDRFLARFGEDFVAVLHSRLSQGERYDEWNKIKEGKAKVVIGARSAIFAPIDNLGIIIIDEEHDLSYKADSTPRYHAKDLAKYISKVKSCPLVLGSATPDLGTMKNAKDGKIKLFTLRNRANNSILPEVEIVDLRYELSKGNRSMISERLKEEIEKNLKNKKQTMLYLNRRGYSTFVMCRDCGYVAKCPNCNVSLTYHMRENKLKCHYCSHEEYAISTCPECGGNKVKYFGTGTQKVEEEIHKLFPEASTIRMDIDTVTKKGSHEAILNTFKDENIDILIGTQMIVKGHHFPNVTLVGVLAADGALNLDDYRAVEKTFQTLVQVSGRAGREHENPGRVIIQTYNPDHYAIIYAQKQDYDLFYEAEIDLRKKLKYPPFCDIILVRFNGKNLSEIKKISDRVYRKILEKKDNTILAYNPVPSPIDKIQGKYRWRIVIKCKVSNKVLDLINYAIEDEIKSNEKDTSIVVDINPNSMN